MRDKQASSEITSRARSSRPPVLVAAIAGCMLLFTLLSCAVVAGRIENVDLSISTFLLERITYPSLTSFMAVFTYLGSATVLRIMYTPIILYFLVNKKYMAAIAMLITGAGGFLLSDLLKLIFHRERPAGSLIGVVSQFSYPSGHAIASIVFYGLLVYLVNRTKLHQSRKIIFYLIMFLITLLIGFSRVYLRAHYFSDVIGGFCVGGAWLLLIILLCEKYEIRVRGRA